MCFNRTDDQARQIRERLDAERERGLGREPRQAAPRGNGQADRAPHEATPHPRGNGRADESELERSVEKLERVLGG